MRIPHRSPRRRPPDLELQRPAAARGPSAARQAHVERFMIERFKIEEADR
jgi:hypothetical protein